MRRWLLALIVVAAIGAAAGWWVRTNAHQAATQPVKSAAAAPIVPSTAQAWPVYTNDKYGFTVRYPTGWHDVGALTPGSELPKVYSNQTSLASTDPNTVALIIDSAAGTSPVQCYPSLSDSRYQYSQSPSTVFAGGLHGTKYTFNPAPSSQQQPQFGIGYLVLRQGRCYDISVVADSASMRDQAAVTAEIVAETLHFL